MKNKILVLLIDDYPSFALTKAAQTTLKNIGEQQRELDIPFITSRIDTTAKLLDSNSTSMSPINVSISNMVEEKYSEYFELKWLRNKDDLQLFKKLCRTVEDQFSSSGLGKIDGVVPEIVLFDYALTGHEDKSFLNETEDLNLLMQVVPVYAIREFLQKEKKELPTADNVSLDVYSIDDGLNSDNIGCMGGIITVSHFRNHLCVGLATSRKSDEHIRGQDVQFLESLVNEPHQFDFSLRGNTKNLTWKTLLSQSAVLLRNRIKTLIQSNKIIPNLTQLMDYVSGEISTEPKERVFTFESTYGERHLPLDGLFIDKVQEHERKDAMIKWTGELLEELYQQKEYTLTTSSLNNAFKCSDELWRRYKDAESVLKRLKISELNYLLSLDDNKLGKELNVSNHAIYNLVAKKKEFKSEYDTLTQEYGLKNNKLEYGYDLRSGNFTCLERRWGALITMMRLHHHFLEYYLKPDPRTSKYSILRSEPQEDDYYLALFPLATSPITIKLHRNDGDNFKNALKRQTSLTGNTTNGDDGLEMDSILNCIADANGLLLKEKYLLNCIIKNENEFPFYKKPLYIPPWLKR